MSEEAVGAAILIHFRKVQFIAGGAAGAARATVGSPAGTAGSGGSTGGGSGSTGAVVSAPSAAGRSDSAVGGALAGRGVASPIATMVGGPEARTPRSAAPASRAKSPA